MQKCADQVRGKRVLAIVDTTEVRCQGHSNRLQTKQGLGPMSDNKTLGYYLQPILCLDACSKSPLGIAGIHLWNRTGMPLTHHAKRYITERESDKWFSPVKQARDTILKDADKVIFVMDREADIYEVLESIPNAQADVVIRSKHNRKVIHEGQKMGVSTFLSDQPVQGILDIQLQSHKSNGQRIRADVRWGSLIIPKVNKGRFLPQTRDTISMSVIEVEERSDRIEKVYWRLWTSMPIHTMEDAIEIIDIYKTRWHIEEFFRILKTEAFDIESSELEKPQNLFKLSVLVMEASLRIKQLKAARNIESEIKVHAVFDPVEIECLEALDRELKGSTEKQSNPFNPQSLSWASWIIARLGGWKGYRSQRPPGSITYKRGLEQFYAFYQGFQLAKLVYKR